VHPLTFWPVRSSTKVGVYSSWCWY
jgi:hypothetical protein